MGTPTNPTNQHHQHHQTSGPQTHMDGLNIQPQDPPTKDNKRKTPTLSSTELDATEMSVSTMGSKTLKTGTSLSPQEREAKGSAATATSQDTPQSPATSTD